MNLSFFNRLRWLTSALFIAGVLLIYRLFAIQFGIDRTYFINQAFEEYRDPVTIRPPRGEIYDRQGLLLATNTPEYEIGLSPTLIVDHEQVADILSVQLGMDRDELLALMQPVEGEPIPPYILLKRPAPSIVGQNLLHENLQGVVVEPIPKRFYPHNALASHVLGFVSYDGMGYYGIEGYYNETLTGQIGVGDRSAIPFDQSRGSGWQAGSTLYLTIDSEIQYLAETMIAKAVQDTGALSGMILVYDPQTGEIIAMANEPRFDPNFYYEGEIANLMNPMINAVFEPGSAMKAITMAIALENGIVTPDSTYEDTYSIEIGGRDIYNWDRQAHGTTTMTELLAKSLNVGAATLSWRLGATRFYNGMANFGFGHPTGIDLQGEVSGVMRVPGDEGFYDANLAVNAFGQGISVTPLQMVVAFGALANDGLIMQPHMVRMRVNPDGSQTTFEPTVINRAVSEITARQVTEMLKNALESEASNALVPGYAIAGKTGTAQIPMVGGYDPDDVITSFIGYAPVDDPQFVVLIRLDKPQSEKWGTTTAAPVFSEFVSRLVVLMEIPASDVSVVSAGD